MHTYVNKTKRNVITDKRIYYFLFLIFEIVQTNEIWDFLNYEKL